MDSTQPPADAATDNGAAAKHETAASSPPSAVHAPMRSELGSAPPSAADYNPDAAGYQSHPTHAASLPATTGAEPQYTPASYPVPTPAYFPPSVPSSSAPPMRASLPTDPDGDIAALPLRTGVVRWFNPTKGYGFLGPPPGESGQDAFVHQNQLRCDGYRSLDKDQVVEYRLKISPEGKHIALAVTAPGGGVLPGTRDAIPPAHVLYSSPGMTMAPPGHAPPPPTASTHGYDGRNRRPPHLPYFTGAIKSWDSAKGYGFVRGQSHSAGAPVPTHDVFVHQNNVHADAANRQLVPGMIIEYTMGVDEKNGKPMAEHVSGQNGGLITQDDIQRASGVTFRRPAVDPTLPPGVMQGIIDRFDAAKRYGFIRPDTGDRQHVFLHASRVNVPLNEIHAGMRVQFSLGRDPQGKDAAVNIIALDGRSRSPNRAYPPQQQRGFSPPRASGGYDAHADRGRYRSPPRDPYYDPYRPQPSYGTQPPPPQPQYPPPPQQQPHYPPQPYQPHTQPPPPADYYGQHPPPPHMQQPPAPAPAPYYPPPQPAQPQYNPNPYAAPPPQPAYQPPAPSPSPYGPPPQSGPPQYSQPPPSQPQYPPPHSQPYAPQQQPAPASSGAGGPPDEMLARLYSLYQTLAPAK